MRVVAEKSAAALVHFPGAFCGGASAKGAFSRLESASGLRLRSSGGNRLAIGGSVRAY